MSYVSGDWYSGSPFAVRGLYSMHLQIYCKKQINVLQKLCRTDYELAEWVSVQRDYCNKLPYITQLWRGAAAVCAVGRAEDGRVHCLFAFRWMACRAAKTDKKPGRPIIITSRNLMSGSCISHYIESKSRWTCRPSLWLRPCMARKDGWIGGCIFCRIRLPNRAPRRAC